jgi:hypothetical protein
MTALATLLRRAIDDGWFPLSPRVKTWQAMLDKIDPAPVRERLPAPRMHAPPRACRRRRG